MGNSQQKSMTKIEDSLQMLALNPGLSHLVNQIFGNLNATELANCRLVSKTLKDFIDNNKYWWILQLRHMKTNTTSFVGITKIGKPGVIKDLIENQFPEWKVANEHFAHNETTERLKSYVFYMWKYFNDNKKNCGNPLSYAARNGQVDFVELLIDTPIDFNAKDKKGLTAIDHACRDNQIEILQLFIRYTDKKNINFEAKGYKGWTSFHHACTNASLDFIKALLDHLKSKQLNLFPSTPDGTNIFHLAFTNPHDDVSKYIYDQFKENIDINSTDNIGWTPLHLVCQLGSLKTLKFVLELQPDLAATTHEGNNCIHLAARNPEAEVLQHLLTSYPTTLANVPGSIGQRCIHKAAFKGMLENVKILFEHFGNKYFDEGDICGNTPLHLASYNGHGEVVKFILEKSDPKVFDINKKNIFSITAEDLAWQCGHTRAFELLKMHRLKSEPNIIFRIIERFK